MNHKTHLHLVGGLVLVGAVVLPTGGGSTSGPAGGGTSARARRPRLGTGTPDELEDAEVRVWHLYLAGSALGFESGDLQVHQSLAVRSADGHSGVQLRPGWDAHPLAAPAAPEPTRLQAAS
jgi:hypothetical protein